MNTAPLVMFFAVISAGVTLPLRASRLDHIVLIGAPASGKTTIQRELERRGYPRILEAARDIIDLDNAYGRRNRWETVEIEFEILRLYRQRLLEALKIPASRNTKPWVVDGSPLVTRVYVEFSRKTMPHSFREELDQTLGDFGLPRQVFLIEYCGVEEWDGVRVHAGEESRQIEAQMLAVFSDYYGGEVPLHRIKAGTPDQRASQIEEILWQESSGASVITDPAAFEGSSRYYEPMVLRQRTRPVVRPSSPSPTRLSERT